MPKTLTEHIAEFVCSKKYADVPPEVIDKAKQCLLDTIGVAFYGRDMKASVVSLEFVRSVGGAEEASILGSAYKAPVSLAAFANGIRAHVAEFDDVLPGAGHTSAVIMPSTLSLAEAKGLSGKKLLNAFVLGVEVAAKLGSAMGRSHYQTGWHTTGTVGTVAAAAGAAKVIGLSERQTAYALGIACSSAAGLRENFGTNTKSFHAGNAASMGVTSALLAKGGYDSSLQALDGNEGFLKAMQGEPDGEVPVKELGRPYSLVRVQVKKYPSCTGTHAAIDAILEFMSRESSVPQAVDSIVIETRTQNRSVLRFPNPRTELQAKFSLQYCVAAALNYGHLSPREFTSEAVGNSVVRRFMKKISVIYSSEMEDLAYRKRLVSPTCTTIILRNGQRVSRLIEEAKGGYSEPLSWSEIEEKFLECSKGLKSAKHFIRRIRHLEKENSMAALMGALR